MISISFVINRILDLKFKAYISKQYYSMPYISVIVPVYNIEPYLRECADSILAQTYTDLEMLLVDDGSTDSSGAICDEYAVRDPRVRAFHKPNGGLTSARNFGLANAKGEWIVHIDGDDWVERDYLEKLISTAEGNKADITFCDFRFDFPDRSVVRNLYAWDKGGAEDLNKYISTGWTCLCGSVQRRSLYMKHNLSSPEGISYCEDFHLIVRLCYFARRIAKVAEPLYHYRQQNSSITHTLNKKTEADEQWVYSDTVAFFKEQGVYEQYKTVMAWRSLKSIQDLALDRNNFEIVRNFNPDIRDNILSCPFIGKKIKIIMWLIVHKFDFAAASILWLRHILGR